MIFCDAVTRCDSTFQVYPIGYQYPETLKMVSQRVTASQNCDDRGNQ